MTWSVVGSMQFAGELAVTDEHDPVGVRRGNRVVRDHHDRLAEVVVRRCA